MATTDTDLDERLLNKLEHTKRKKIAKTFPLSNIYSSSSIPCSILSFLNYYCCYSLLL